jgi:chaperonin GroES
MIVYWFVAWLKKKKPLAVFSFQTLLKKNPKKGEIVATGKGRVTEDGKVLPLEVKAGDKVLFSKYAGTELKLDGQEYLMMKEEDVLGIFH